MNETHLNKLLDIVLELRKDLSKEIKERMVSEHKMLKLMRAISIDGVNLAERMQETAENEVEKLIPEKGIKWMQEGNRKDRKGFTEGFNFCREIMND